MFAIKNYLHNAFSVYILDSEFRKKNIAKKHNNLFPFVLNQEKKYQLHNWICLVLFYSGIIQSES